MLAVRPDDGVGDVAQTLPDLFAHRVARTPELLAYRQFDWIAGRWCAYSWAAIAREVARWRAAIVSERLERGDRVAILLPNGIDWVCLDQAALSLGLVVVPLYTADSPYNFARFLEETGAALLLIDNEAQWQEIASEAADLPQLQRVVVVKGSVADRADPRLRALADWLPSQGPVAGDLAIAPDELATIVYTSGTTGRPKGVMLSHRNILSAVTSVLDRIPGRPDDTFISYLPLAHIFERTVGYYLPMMVGASVGYARSTRSVAEDLLVIRPTVFLGVPRVFERAFATVRGATESKLLAARLLDWTLAVGWRRFEAAQARTSPPGLVTTLAWPLLRYLVCRRILNRFGGKVRIAVTGGAPMTPAIARFFLSLGLPLVEGYGLAESAGPVSSCALDDNVVGSVGRPFAGVEATTTDSGELLIRAESVMRGYWNQPEGTRQAVDGDGWLHTGDLAEIADGRIYIRGRLKEIIVLSTGENVSPSELEAALIMDPLIAQVMVVGDRRPFLSALIVLHGEAWRRLASGLGLDPSDPRALVSERVNRAVLGRLADTLRDFPRYAQIRAVHLMLGEWTIDAGQLTATLKLRREAIESRYASELEAAYEKHEREASRV